MKILSEYPNDIYWKGTMVLNQSLIVTCFFFSHIIHWPNKMWWPENWNRKSHRKDSEANLNISCKQQDIKLQIYIIWHHRWRSSYIRGNGICLWPWTNTFSCLILMIMKFNKVLPRIKGVYLRGKVKIAQRLSQMSQTLPHN